MNLDSYVIWQIGMLLFALTYALCAIILTKMKS